jgi:flavin reductase (DIM6/NTAB) family NADH-FMN oxidoreductase RutF/rubredoxin
MNIEAFYRLSYGLYIVSSGNPEKYNGYIANTAFQVTAEPPQLAVVCNKDNITASIIQKTKGFSVSVLQQETKPEILGLFGYQSGKNINKFENINFIKGKTGIPIVLEDTIAWFECELVQQFDVGSHIVFIGKIINNDLVNKRLDPLTYAYYQKVKKGEAPKNAPTYQENTDSTKKPEVKQKKYKCLICGHIYDPEEGDPDSGIPPGTAFEDLPENWACPVCGAEKDNFVEV